MRKNRHLPNFHKAHFSDPLKSFNDGRRAHRLTPREAPAPSVVAKAASRQHLYQHSMARQMGALRAALARRA